MLWIIGLVIAYIVIVLLAREIHALNQRNIVLTQRIYALEQFKGEFVEVEDDSDAPESGAQDLADSVMPQTTLIPSA